jgi:hypothetical protein
MIELLKLSAYEAHTRLAVITFRRSGRRTHRRFKLLSGLLSASVAGYPTKSIPFQPAAMKRTTPSAHITNGNITAMVAQEWSLQTLQMRAATRHIDRATNGYALHRKQLMASADFPASKHIPPRAMSSNAGISNNASITKQIQKLLLFSLIKSFTGFISKGIVVFGITFHETSASRTYLRTASFPTRLVLICVLPTF